jgi:hypothetical protein
MLMNQGQAMDGKLNSLCTDTQRFQGRKVGCMAPLSCEPMIGPLLHSGYGYCTDLSIGKFGMTAAMRASMVAQRRSISGAACRLPLFYKCARISAQLSLPCAPCIARASCPAMSALPMLCPACEPGE